MGSSPSPTAAHAENARIDAYIDQLCAWRTDAAGHSIKHLRRDMVMATLFAESEAFVMANRPAQKVKIHSQVKPPRWAMRRYESAHKARERQREHDEKVTRAQEMAQRIGPLH